MVNPLKLNKILYWISSRKSSAFSHLYKLKVKELIHFAAYVSLTCFIKQQLLLLLIFIYHLLVYNKNMTKMFCMLFPAMACSEIISRSTRMLKFEEYIKLIINRNKHEESTWAQRKQYYKKQDLFITQTCKQNN